MPSLASFATASALISHIASNTASGISGVAASAVSVTISSITVNVQTVLTPSSLSNATNRPLVAQGFANHANVPVSSVTVTEVTGGRRLFLEAQVPEEESEERRLQSATVNVAIVASNASDVVTAAQNIHAAVGNATTLAAALANTTGVTVTATPTVSFAVSVTTVISSSTPVDAHQITQDLGSSLNGTATLHSYDHGGAITTTAKVAPSSHASHSAGFVFVAFMSVLLAIKAI
jgi:hypothetical protein